MLQRRRPPVLLVHGFDGFGAKDCRAEMAPLAARLGSRATIVGFYAEDRDPDVWLPGDRATTQTSLVTLGAQLAGLVRSYDAPVNLVGHSMGGLVVALAAAALPAGAVRRVVLLGVPFRGLPSAVGADVTQCREMSPGSALLAELQPRADLVVASEADEAVPVESALACAARRSLRVPAGREVRHGDLLSAPSVLSRVARTLR